jgi:type I restriction enzyme S subunit
MSKTYPEFSPLFFKNLYLEHVPNEWSWMKLGDISTPKQWDNLSTDSFTESGYPVYGANGVVGFYSKYNHENRVIAISCRGACGDVHLTKPYSFVTSNAMCLDNVSDDVLDTFLFYGLQYRSLKDTITGSAQPQITRQSLQNVCLPIPPLPEQKKIASILTSVDEVMENTQKQIDKLQELKRATMNELLTRGIGHTEFKDSELGRIPKSWEVKTIGELSSKVGSGVTPRGGSSVYQEQGVLFIRSQNVHFDGLKLNDAAYISDTIHAGMQGSKVFGGDVLLNITGASIGRCAVVTDEFPESNVNQHVCIIRPINSLHNHFLGLWLSSDFGQGQIMRFQAGGNREGLNFEQIRSMSLPLPTMCEQKQCAKVVTAIQSSITEFQQKLSQTQSLKKSLMQDLLTGKVRVQVN